MNEPENGQTILIVEDHDDLRLLYSKILEKVGFNVITAKDGDHAWEILQAVRVDLVVTDYEMPGLNGLELIAKVKKHVDPSPAIILISGSEEISKLSASNLGLCEFLPKPILPVTLVAVVRKCLEHDATLN